jgi:hypothetical protein
MDNKALIRNKLFANKNNFKQSRWKPVRDFIEQYYDEIELFVKRGGRLSHLASVIEDETGVTVPIPTISVIKSQIKRKRAKPLEKWSETGEALENGRNKWEKLKRRIMDLNMKDY